MTGIELISSIFILIGAFLVLLSAIGVIRLPDVYTRMHAAGKSSTLGVIFLMIAVVIYFLSQGIFNAKILLVILFVFMTAPLSALLVNRSAYRTGVPLDKSTVQDDLKEMYNQK